MDDLAEAELAACSAGAAARLLKISTAQLHNWRREGRIKARLGLSGRWLFDVRPFVKTQPARRRRQMPEYDPTLGEGVGDG